MDRTQWMERFRSRIVQLSTESEGGRGYYYALFAPDGSVFAKTANMPAQPRSHLSVRIGPAVGPFRPPAPPVLRSFGSYRKAIRDLPHGETLIVGRSIEPELTAMRRLTLSLLAAGGALLLLGLAGGWVFAARAIRPIGVISETAAHIAGGDLSRRIAVKEMASELGGLTRVLNSTFDKLEATFDRQARFTSDASHELRTPISVMLFPRSNSRFPASDPRRISGRSACLPARRPTHAPSDGVSACTLAPRRQSGAHAPRALRLHPHGARLSGTGPATRWENNVEFVCDLPPMECLGDEDRLSQVVLNLTSNAIQFSPNGGTVSVSVARKENAAELKVSDSGIGIGEQDLPHIFDRFYRADKSRSRSDGRSGLGLSICQSIVKAHGGSISVCSVPGSGSAFTVLLPDAVEPPA